ncbi:hypothetical protein BKA65DRAFT_550093 [Rhexocercosporidium sp. MPI-PUGE-AT-0058]|nr:hypothetical protein BKA65DRAFT_550093 [Rhexocercosporidium sp. MPI-PUGE-AT-0058]
MAPFVEVFPAGELPFRTQLTLKGTARKDFHGDLKGCELLALWQYECEVERPVTRESVTRCVPVERLFRRCKDGQKTFMVETTAWEGEKKGKGV